MAVSLQETKFEALQKYVDIQSILSGEEAFGLEKTSQLIITEEYNASRDIAFFETPENFTDND